jgi:hypothetical protein
MNRTERLYRIDQTLKRSRGVTREIEYRHSQLHALIVFDPNTGYRFDTAQQVAA